MDRKEFVMAHLPFEKIEVHKEFVMRTFWDDRIGYVQVAWSIYWNWFQLEIILALLLDEGKKYRAFYRSSTRHYEYEKKRENTIGYLPVCSQGTNMELLIDIYFHDDF